MIPWTDLKDLSQLDEVDDQSAEVPVLVFKHSTRCGVSSLALKRIEGEWDSASLNVKPYFLDLLKYRSVSDAISSRWHVRHESPQMILIRNRSVVCHASHDGIDLSILKSV